MGRIRTVKVKAWTDICSTNNQWGVEVDSPFITMDGHYICYTGAGELGRERAEIIADAINGRRTPKREIED